MLRDGDVDHLRKQLAIVFRQWLSLPERDREVLTERVLRPALSHAQTARILKVSRVTLYKCYKRIVKRFPDLERFLFRRAQ